MSGSFGPNSSLWWAMWLRRYPASGTKPGQEMIHVADPVVDLAVREQEAVGRLVAEDREAGEGPTHQEERGDPPDRVPPPVREPGSSTPTDWIHTPTTWPALATFGIRYSSSRNAPIGRPFGPSRTAGRTSGVAPGLGKHRARRAASTVVAHAAASYTMIDSCATDCKLAAWLSGMAAPDRPLSARSVIASTLLGTDPPELPSAALVRVGALFDMGEGTVRTALVPHGHRRRRARPGRRRPVPAGRRPAHPGRDPVGESSRGGHDVDRTLASGGRRSPARDPASDRSSLRRAMTRLRFGELRDGVWLRPDNLDPTRWPDAHGIVDAQCRWFAVSPDRDDELSTVAVGSRRLDRPGHRAPAIDGRTWSAGSTPAIRPRSAPGFVVSAAVLRHFNADPLLPPELQPRHWPGGPPPRRLRPVRRRLPTPARRVPPIGLTAGTVSTTRGDTVTTPDPESPDSARPERSATSTIASTSASS